MGNLGNIHLLKYKLITIKKNKDTVLQYIFTPMYSKLNAPFFTAQFFY